MAIEDKQLSISTFQEHIDYVKAVVSNDGISPNEHDEHLKWFNTLDQRKKKGLISEKEIDSLLALFDDVYSTPLTLIGFGRTKPHGYAGDFEIIDKIYTHHISNNPRFQKYDAFFQAQAAPQAVRNRKTYFKNILKEKSTIKNCRVLNLASGPCRGLAEVIEENSMEEMTIDCVDLDEHAIAYARRLVRQHPNIAFHHQNILKYSPNKKYDLIWSAGLFDYFNDKYFVRLLNRFLAYVEVGGELIIGNFHPSNPTRSFMEIGGKWFLHHRTAANLIALAKEAGIHKKASVRIEKEPLGVNLFMRIRK